MASIHDHFLLGYSVDSSRREILLRTAFRDHRGEQKVNVIFSEVAAYQFKNDSFGTILYRVDKVDPNQLFLSHWEMIQEGCRQSGWLGEWASSSAKAAEYFQKNSIGGFEIGSSVGMSGWLMARSMEIVELR